MFGYGVDERADRAFADQFEPDGKIFLYRKQMKGAPILVSAAERERFINQFYLSRILSKCCLVAAVLGFAALQYFYFSGVGSDLSQWATYAAFILFMAAFVAANRWAWDAPARALRGRGTVGEARTTAEVRSLLLARMSYVQLAVLGGLPVLFLLSLNADYDPFAGWNLLWLALAAATFVTAVVLAMRKWRMENPHGR